MTGQLLGSPETAFYAACALLLLAVAVVAIVLKPALALWALAVLFLTEFATPLPLDTSLAKAGTTHIYPADAVAVVLLIATAIYLIRQPPPARIMFPLAVAWVMFTVNLALGVATFGLQHAVNESREWLYLLTTTAFVVAAGPWTSRFWRPWYALAFGAMGLAWLGVARHGLHSATSQIVINGQLVDGRPLNSAGAAALAFALIVLLGSRTISVRRKIVFGTAAICTLIVVEQRTVWAVLAVAFLIWAAASLRRHGTARHRRLAATGVAVLSTVAVALAAGVATGNVFDQSLAETTAKHSTFQWRVIGWTDLLHTEHSAAGLLLGFRFGTGYRRIIDGQVITSEPAQLLRRHRAEAGADRPGRSRLPVLERVEVSPPGGGRAGYLTADRSAAADRAGGIFAHLPAQLRHGGAGRRPPRVGPGSRAATRGRPGGRARCPAAG